MLNSFSFSTFIILLSSILFGHEASAKYCYINIEDHLKCGPSASNSDLHWTPNPAARLALFQSAEVQSTGDGCEYYGKLIKSECNPDLPVATVFYALDNSIIIRSYIVQRSISLFKAPRLPTGIRNYLYSRIKLPSGDWTSKTFLATVKLEENMNLLDYVAMMNRLYNKYPMNDYKAAYTDYITGDNEMFYMNMYLDSQPKNIMTNILPIIFGILLD